MGHNTGKTLAIVRGCVLAERAVRKTVRNPVALGLGCDNPQAPPTNQELLCLGKRDPIQSTGKTQSQVLLYVR